MLMHRGAKIPRVLPATPMLRVIEEMTGKKLGVTCVVSEDDTLYGVITDGDLRRMMRKHKEGIFGKNARECMTANPVTVDRERLATEALNLMEERKITSLVVTDRAGKVEGIIHLHDLWRTEMV
jgi:arabinose-5-phosphate isomerase